MYDSAMRSDSARVMACACTANAKIDKNNDETRMTKPEARTKRSRLEVSSFGFRICFVIRHSDFVILLMSILRTGNSRSVRRFPNGNVADYFRGAVFEIASTVACD